MNIIIVPYASNSDSAVALQSSLTNAGASATIKRRGAAIRYGNELVINWGCSEMGAVGNNVLNSPEAVGRASSKLAALKAMQEANVPCPVFTTSITKAKEWAMSGGVVYARTKLRGSAGEGIVIMTRANAATVAPTLHGCQLFTRGIRGGKEYRVHVFKGQVIDVVEKRRRSGIADAGAADADIRNLANGYVYCRDGVSLAANGKRAAISAVATLGLDFGAVDIIYKDDRPYVLEVNTAPGLEGTTLTSYVNAIKAAAGLNLSSATLESSIEEDEDYYDEYYDDADEF